MVAVPFTWLLGDFTNSSTSFKPPVIVSATASFMGLIGGYALIHWASMGWEMKIPVFVLIPWAMCMLGFFGVFANNVWYMIRKTQQNEQEVES